jgi:ribosomal protein L20
MNALDLDKFSLTFYLIATNKKDRVKTTVWIERIYKEILDKEGIPYSDLINHLLEIWLRQTGRLQVEQYLAKSDD